MGHRARNSLALRVSPELALQVSSKTGAGPEVAATAAAPMAYCNLACWLLRRISTVEAAAPSLELGQGQRALVPSHLLSSEDAPVRLKTVVGSS